MTEKTIAPELDDEFVVRPPDVSHLITEDDTPVDNIFSARQMALLRSSRFTDPNFNFHLYSNGKAAARTSPDVCFDCLTDCPRNGIGFHVVLRPAPWRSYDPSRRTFLASALTAVTGFALLRTAPAVFRRFATLIRPPGSVEATLLARCIRCGECMQVCPTAGLQPSLLEADLEGLWTPRLVPRLGYCDYGCTNCGRVCPTEAIPRLTLDEKRRTVMGLAYLDKDRCIPWADDRDCFVCEEMCPSAAIAGA